MFFDVFGGSTNLLRTRLDVEDREYLEDHPRSRKWLITMVIVITLGRVGLVMNRPFMAYKWGWPYLLGCPRKLVNG